MKSKFLSLILFYSLVGITLAADDLYSPTKHSYVKTTSVPKERPALLGDLRTVFLQVYQQQVTINTTLREKLERASIPYGTTHHLPHFPLVQEVSLETGADFVKRIFANIRNTLLEIISGVEQENIELRKLLTKKKETQTVEPTLLRINSEMLGKPPAPIGDLRAVIMQVCQEQVTLNTALRKQLEQASIYYVSTQHLSTFFPVQSERLETGTNFVQKIFANIRSTVLRIITGVEQENSEMRSLLEPKKQRTIELLSIVTTSPKIATEPKVTPSKKPPKELPALAVTTPIIRADSLPPDIEKKTPGRPASAAASPATTPGSLTSERRASTPVAGVIDSPQRRDSIVVDVMAPHTPQMNRFLSGFEIQRYNNFVSKLTVPRKILSTLEPSIKEALERIKGSVFVVAAEEQKLIDALNVETLTVDEGMTILQKEVRSPKVFHSDRTVTYATLEDELEEQRRRTEELEIQDRIIRDTAVALARSGISSGWGKLLPAEEIGALEAQIKEIISLYHNEEIPNISGGGGTTPLESLIGLIQTAQGTIPEKLELEGAQALIKVVRAKITKFRKKELRKLQELMARGKELVASIPEPTVRQQEVLEFFTTLHKTNTTPVLDITSPKALETMRLQLNEHVRQKKEFELIIQSPTNTGFVVVPLKESKDQLHVNLKAFSLVKPKLDLKQAKLNFKPPYKYEPRYYKATLSPAETDRLNELLTEKHVLWVFEPHLTKWEFVIYFFGIPIDPSLQVVSLTLGQGSARLDGNVFDYIDAARMLMS